MSVFFGGPGDRDYRVGVENCGPFYPETHGITTTELLGLLGAQWFEATGCQKGISKNQRWTSWSVPESDEASFVCLTGKKP